MALDVLSKRLERHGESAVKRLAYSLKVNEGNASGRLERSIEHKVKASKNQVVFTILMEDYWEAASFGRKAGKAPPRDKIIDWLTYPSVQDKIKGRDELPSGKEILNLAYAIQNKIANKGTEGSHFTDVIFESKEYQNEELEVIEDSFNQDLEELLDKVMTETALKTVELGDSGVKVTIKDI
jgi:hypothetical protein